MLDKEVGDDIAIIGMACRVAGANSPTELWDLLATSKDVQSEITRFNMRGFYSPEGGPLKGLTNVKNAYMMDDDVVDRFDHTFFRITPQEAIAIDPQQRMLLELAYETVESAGSSLDDFVGSNTAVFAGVEGCDYHTILARDIDTTPKYLATGTATCMNANRISYFFDLSGPSITVDSACSSAMSALHQAVNALRLGESGTALVCGAKLILNPDMFMPATELGFLSPSGRCRTFDAQADGYGRGEGVFGLLLKPLHDALAHNDPIRAVIKGTRLNQDGRTQGITLPSATAQRDNMKALYDRIGLSPDRIQYFEAHGTGTGAGDPLEASAIGAVFRSPSRSQDLVVGSIKANIGHLEACSALAGIVKTVQCLERGEIPSQMHFEKPNPKINFAQLHIPTGKMKWPATENLLRTAAVNSFGAGGTNGHVVLQAHVKPRKQTDEVRRPLLFKLSANTEKVLEVMRDKCAKFVKEEEFDIQSLAYTLLSRRSTMSKTIFFSAQDKEQLLTALKLSSSKVSGRSSFVECPVLFIFTGQGAQWPGMGKDLLAYSPLFASTVRDCEKILRALPDGPKWSLVEEYNQSAETSNIYKSSYSQPLCTVLQIGLIELWRFWGLRPNAVIGHSSGEIAAAYAAGMISLKNAVITAYYRGLYLNGLGSGTNGRRVHGSMCAVSITREDAEQLVSGYDGRIQVAAVNAPSSCTLSGDADAIQDLVRELKKLGTFCRELRVDTAFHSHHIIPAASRYERALVEAGVSSEPTTSCSMFSSVTGEWISSEHLTPSYWTENMTSTVLFAPALESCLRSSSKKLSLVEIGPHPALRGPAREVARAVNIEIVEYFQSCYRYRPDFDSLLESAGEMLATGLRLDLVNINKTDEIAQDQNLPQVVIDLPPYPWDHSTSFWYETGISKTIRQRKHLRHLVLGSRSVDDSRSTPSWRNQIRLDEIPFLQEHENTNTSLDIKYILFITMAAEAARQTRIDQDLASTNWEVSNVEFDSSLGSLALDDARPIADVHLNAKKVKDAELFDFGILMLVDHTKEACSGRISFSHPPAPKYLRASEFKPNGNDPLQVLTVPSCKIPECLTNISMRGSKAEGSFHVKVDAHNTSWPDLEILYSIFNLPLSLTAKDFPPAVWKLTSVKCLTVVPTSERKGIGQFEVRTSSHGSSGTESDIRIWFGANVLVIDGVRMDIDHLSENELPLKTLFNVPSTLPDIGYMTDLSQCSLEDLFLLVTHKWPMADIGIIGFSMDTSEDLLRLIFGKEPPPRTQYRSVQVQQTEPVAARGKVRFVRDLEPDTRFHLLILGKRVEGVVLPHLQPQGLLCCSAPESPIGDPLEQRLERIGPLKHTQGSSWTVHRPYSDTQGCQSFENTVIFADIIAPLPQVQNQIPNAEFISMDLQSVDRFCARKRTNKFTAIIVEANDSSVINSWQGDHLLPWLRHLMFGADKIVWVTVREALNPYCGLAGILLRTLQAEHPSLRVTWLVMSQNDVATKFDERVLEALEALSSNDNEIRREWVDQVPRITRYKADDELSAEVGHTPAMMVTRTLRDDYSLTLVAKRSIAFSNPAAHAILGSGSIPIKVEASVVDIEDILDFMGLSKGHPTKGRGAFFAGRVMDSRYGRFAPNAHVVGWHGSDSAYSNNLFVSEQHVFPSKVNLTHEHNAASFAALATTLCLVDGFARVRDGDTVRLDLEGPLGQTIRHVVTAFGGVVTNSTERSDFHITICDSQGLLLNGKRISSSDVTRYLASERGMQVLAQKWKEHIQVNHPLNSINITASERAFNIPLREAFATVIVHEPDTKPVRQLITQHTQRPLLSADGIYIIIGGLGGLGRYVCSWMIANGAKNVVAMSRRGINSSEAQSTFDDINATGASMKVVKVDACNVENLSTAFAAVRAQGRIRGVMNMAMILADAPIAVMTGEQWDAALRLKVDSSWNLHQETLQDELDFFTLFSSIASVLGNRNQGGYNVGNAFLNALAEYRHSLGLPAVAIALGAMTEIGVLHELSNTDLLSHLSRSGLTPLTRHDLSKILEASIIESPLRRRPVIVTGLEMFQRINGKIVGSHDQTQLYWTELKEFMHLQDHILTDEGGGGPGKTKLGIKERLNAAANPRNGTSSPSKDTVYDILLDAFLDFLAQLQGFEKDAFDTSQSLASYGFDSLSAVSCQFWFHRELGIDVSSGDVLNSKTIGGLIEIAVGRFESG